MFVVCRGLSLLLVCTTTIDGCASRSLSSGRVLIAPGKTWSGSECRESGQQIIRYGIQPVLLRANQPSYLHVPFHLFSNIFHQVWKYILCCSSSFRSGREQVRHPSDTRKMAERADPSTYQTRGIQNMPCHLLHSMKIVCH